MQQRQFRPAGVALGLLACALLAGCSYQGNIDNPLTLKATWFSYLNGDDIRAGCTEGSGRRYRLVYNADYDEQLRSYEVADDGAGGAMLVARVQGPSGLVVNNISFSDPLGWARWTKSVTALSAQDVGRLDAALEESGALAAPPQGLQLFSKETYWISILCRDGMVSFNAWRFPSDRYEAITFDDLLFALDGTGVEVRAPQAVPVGASARASVPRRQESSDARGSFFNVKVGDDGLIGYTAL